MTNHDYIKNLSVKELAEMLVKETEIYDDDDDGDGYVMTTTYYVGPEGMCGYGYADVLQATIDWLNKEKD